MARTPRAVSTPGETPTATEAGQDATQSTGDAFQAQATQLGDQGSAAPAAETSDSDLRALVAAQNAQIAALMGAVAQLQRTQAAPTAKAALEASLPDIDSVDVDKINEGNTPVLTKQGWVVPPTYGTDPARLQELRDQALNRQVMGDLAKKLVG